MISIWHRLHFRLDHRWARAHLSAYLDLDMRTRLRVRLERHTAECPQCRVVLGELRRMLVLLESVSPPEPVIDGPAIAGRVLLQLHEPSSG